MIRGEFLEIPGLQLTKDQIQLLWGLRPDTCTKVLEALLSDRFLQLTAEGYYLHRSFTGTRHLASHVEVIDRELAVYGH